MHLGGWGLVEANVFEWYRCFSYYYYHRLVSNQISIVKSLSACHLWSPARHVRFHLDKKYTKWVDRSYWSSHIFLFLFFNSAVLFFKFIIIIVYSLCFIRLYFVTHLLLFFSFSLLLFFFISFSPYFCLLSIDALTHLSDLPFLFT